MRSLCVALVLGLLCAGGAGAAVITFEDLSGQSTLPSNYAGLTWSDGWEHYDFEQSPYTPSSGVQRAYNNSGSAPPRFQFAGPVTFNGAYFAGNENAGYTLYLSGLPVATSPTLSLGGTGIPVWVPSNYSGLVDEVRLSAVSQGSFVIDDITYNGGNAVPEPGTYLLLATGLCALALLSRKK